MFLLKGMCELDLHAWGGTVATDRFAASDLSRVGIGPANAKIASLRHAIHAPLLHRLGIVLLGVVDRAAGRGDDEDLAVAVAADLRLFVDLFVLGEEPVV